MKTKFDELNKLSDELDKLNSKFDELDKLSDELDELDKSSHELGKLNKLNIKLFLWHHHAFKHRIDLLQEFKPIVTWLFTPLQIN